MSERVQERAERVRRALTEWDASLGEQCLPEERVARMRAVVLDAGAEHARDPRPRGSASAGWLVVARPRGQRLALALTLAAGALLVAVLGVRRSASVGEHAEPGAGAAPVIAEAGPSRPDIDPQPPPKARRAVDERAGAEDGLPRERIPTEPITARPIDGGRRADRAAGLIEDGAEVLSVGAAAAADRLTSAGPTGTAPGRDRARFEDEGSHGRGTAPVDLAALEAPTGRRDAVGRTESGAGSRRIRRLDFETPSGRKIHWTLDSEFRGLGGR